MKKKEIRETINNLPVVERRHGFIGLNVKLYHFPKPISDVLWSNILIADAFEDWFGTLIFNIFEDIRNFFPVPIYTTGKSGGYWGFFEHDLKKEGLTPRKAIRKLKKHLVDMLYYTFKQNEIQFFNLGRDLNNQGTDFIYLQLIYNIKKNQKYCSLDGVPQWCSFEEQINKYLKDDEYSKIARLFKEFSIAWQYKDILLAA